MPADHVDCSVNAALAISTSTSIDLDVIAAGDARDSCSRRGFYPACSCDASPCSPSSSSSRSSYPCVAACVDHSEPAEWLSMFVGQISSRPEDAQKEWSSEQYTRRVSHEQSLLLNILPRKLLLKLLEHRKLHTWVDGSSRPSGWGRFQAPDGPAVSPWGSPCRGPPDAVPTPGSISCTLLSWMAPLL